MPTYKIPITVEMYGVYKVEADSLEEAIQKYETEGSGWSLPELDYVDASERMEDECIGLINSDVMTPKDKEKYDAFL